MMNPDNAGPLKHQVHTQRVLNCGWNPSFRTKSRKGRAESTTLRVPASRGVSDAKREAPESIPGCAVWGTMQNDWRSSEHGHPALSTNLYNVPIPQVEGRYRHFSSASPSCRSNLNLGQGGKLKPQRPKEEVSCADSRQKGRSWHGGRHQDNRRVGRINGARDPLPTSPIQGRTDSSRNVSGRKTGQEFLWAASLM